MKQSRQFLCALGLVFATLGSAQAIPLSTLLHGGSITAGDKLFSDWSFTYAASDLGHSHRIFNPASIDVSALNDGGDNPGPGLQFDVSSGELSVTGNGVYAYVDLQLGFRVTVLDPTRQIKDNSLSLGGLFMPYQHDGDNDTGAYILETVGTAAFTDNLGVKEVEGSVLDEITTFALTDSAEFLPQSEIWVSKNILVWSVDTTDTASLTQFTQRFSQTVPEPGTLALLCIAGLAGCLARNCPRFSRP
jgi:hypothetical protein